MEISINQKIQINFIYKEVKLAFVFIYFIRKIIINKEEIILIFKQRNTLYIEEKECNLTILNLSFLVWW